MALAPFTSMLKHSIAHHFLNFDPIFVKFASEFTVSSVLHFEPNADSSSGFLLYSALSRKNLYSWFSARSDPNQPAHLFGLNNIYSEKTFNSHSIYINMA